MRKKPSKIKWEDIFITLSYENTKIRFYNSGMITINGDTRCGAIAFAKHVLENMALGGTLNYNCIKIHLKKDSKYSVDWVGEEYDNYYIEPKFWKEFKIEFERYCELKAFL